jgi:hypothetical protein
MALSKEEIDTIKEGVNKARKKSMAFAFAKKRKDGRKDPILLIDKTESMVKKTIRVDGAPPLMWGWIEMVEDKKRMAFIVDKGKPKELQQAMLKGLKKAHTILNKAKIVTREEFDAELALDASSKDGVQASETESRAGGEQHKVQAADGDVAGAGAGAAAGGWTAGLADEMKAAGEAVLSMFEQFKKDPDSVDIKEMYKESNKLDKATQGDTFVELKVAAKKDKEWRSERKEFRSRLTENRKATKSMAKEIKSMIKEIKKMDASESDAKRKDAIDRVNAEIQKLETMKAEAVQLEAKRGIG